MKRKTIVWLLAGTTTALAAMGLWFCWQCPSRFYAAHELFWKQIAGNILGFALFAGAMALGWRRCLKAAPWLMGMWLLAFAAAHFGRPVNGAHRWLVLDGIFPNPFAMVHINIAMCFIPVFALFVAWLHERRWMRQWMEQLVFVAWFVGIVCHVARSESRMMRLVAFLHPSSETSKYSYMGEQLRSALSAADWFGNAGRKLDLLPCPESDGMISAAALLFGKWFPAMVCVLFGIAGIVFVRLWQGSADSDAPKRRYLLLFAIWFLAPAIYCYSQSLGILPVAGFPPALVGASGTAAAMAWFGMGVSAAMAMDERSQQAPLDGTGKSRCRVWSAVGLTLLAASAIVWVPSESGKFHEGLPVKGHDDPFARIPERGTIVAADGSMLACPMRKWSFHLDPMFPIDKDTVRSFAEELATVFDIPQERLLADLLRTDSRYIPLKDVEDDGLVDLWYRNRGRELKRCGLIREPVQARFAPLGDATLPVVGSIHRVMAWKEPVGASGLEYLFDRDLKGTGNVPGAIVHTTIEPFLQKNVDAFLAAACMSNKATAAWGIVLKIPSGEIAAMVSVCGDANGVTHTSYNGAAHCNFEPGELIMPITYAIALDEGLCERNGNTVGDAIKGGMTIPESLAKRVDIADCKTALEIGANQFHEHLKNLGFGSKVSGRTVLGEETGIVADVKRWDITTCAHVSMGHGIAATGLQIAQAYATLANHGELVSPRLVAKITERKSGSTVKDFLLATNETKQVLSPFAADSIARMLGNGCPATIQMTEGGKYSSTNFMAACAGVAPCDNPRYAILVALENISRNCADKAPAQSVWDEVSCCIQQMATGQD